MKAGAAVAIIGLGVGVVTLVLVTRKAEAAPPPLPPVAEIPTADDIMGAQSIAELNAWYNLIGELYITGKISHEEYMALYNAYYERWYELIGGS